MNSKIVKSNDLKNHDTIYESLKYLGFTDHNKYYFDKGFFIGHYMHACTCTLILRIIVK